MTARVLVLVALVSAIRRRSSGADQTDCQEPLGALTVPDLVVGRGGAMGVTRVLRGERAVLSIVAPGVVSPADAGPGIGLRSLRMEDGSMTWLHDGQRRSVPLP